MRISKFVIIMLVIVGAVFALLGCSQGAPATSTSTNTFISSQQEGIWVTGTGKVTVTPDLATLSLGVEAQESSVAQAQTEANQAMDSIVSVLKTQGIADEDIQTQRFSIQQVTRYDQTTQQEVVIGYMVDNIVTAKIRNLDNVGKIIDAVAQASGNLTRINGVSFSVEDPTQYYSEARTKAVQDAQQRASQLASLNKVTLGKVTFISESGQTIPPVVSTSVAVPALTTQETPISPGQMEITLTVQVAYEIAK
jgi:uncharacterized protein YggE